MEVTFNRLLRVVPKTFGTHAFQCFVPIARRDLGVFELLTGGFIFVRSKSLGSLARLKRVTGVMGLMTIGDTAKIQNVVRVPHGEVQPMILQSEEREASWSRGIKVGSFVRILDGWARGFCGHVVESHLRTVRVQMFTKTLTVVTPDSNLLHLPDVPTSEQVFYYFQKQEY